MHFCPQAIRLLICMLGRHHNKVRLDVFLPQTAEACCTGWQEEMGVGSMVAQHHSASPPWLLNRASRKRGEGVASLQRAQVAVEV